jgi:effector-binding domain-containing protein
MQSIGTFRLLRLEDNRVLVAWKMEGELKFLAKWFRYFLDEAVGKDFELGLSNIKKLAETIERNGVYFFRDTFPETKIIYISDSTSLDPSEIQETFADAFQELMAFANKNGLSYAGNPISIYRSYSTNGMTFDACLPVESLGNAQPTERIRFGTIPKIYVLRTVYLGAYDGFSKVYARIKI